jgi:hypothetical protein
MGAANRLHHEADYEACETAEQSRRHADLCDREPRGRWLHEQADDETGDATGYPEPHHADDGEAGR